MARWTSILLGALIALGISGGIPALIVIYGQVGALDRDSLALRRDLEKLDEKTKTYGEAIARLEERSHCRDCTH